MRGKPMNYGIIGRPQAELPALLPTADFAESGY
jgi:hypothetical protein